MSKVKIQGNATGTGIFNIAAPATNTDRTLTLPDTNSTLFTEAGGTIQAPVSINSDIDESSAYSAQLTLNSNNKATGQYARLLFQHSDHGSASIASDYESSGYGNLIFSTRNGGNPSEKMRLDANGRLTLPYQPMFEAKLTASPSWTITAGSAVPFNYVLQNTGNHFNTSTYKFTAPVTGLYWFGFQAYFGITSGHVRVIHLYWQINDGNFRHCPQGGGTTGSGPGYEFHPTMASTQLIKLSANDTVRMYVNGIDTPGGTPKWYDDTRFYGYLIG